MYNINSFLWLILEKKCEYSARKLNTTLSYEAGRENIYFKINSYEKQMKNAFPLILKLSFCLNTFTDELFAKVLKFQPHIQLHRSITRNMSTELLAPVTEA